MACKAAALALVLAGSFAGQVLAGQCEVDIAKIDKALDGMELAPDERAAYASRADSDMMRGACSSGIGRAAKSF